MQQQQLNSPNLNRIGKKLGHHQEKNPAVENKFHASRNYGIPVIGIVSVTVGNATMRKAV